MTLDATWKYLIWTRVDFQLEIRVLFSIVLRLCVRISGFTEVPRFTPHGV